MRICFFANVSVKAEFETILFLKNDIRALRELGHDVAVCNKWRQIPRNIELIFAWFWTYGGFKALLASRILGIPILSPGNLHYSDPGPHNFNSLPLINRIIKKKTIKHMDMLLPTSLQEYNDLKKHFTFKSAKLVYHGIDCPQKEALVPLEKREDAVLTIAFLNSYGIIRKRIMDVVRCAEIIQKRSINLMFYIAGRETQNKEFERIKRYIKEKNIVNVTFLGHISNSEKEDLFHSVKYYLQPTMYEGFGVAIAEAMSYGVPVLTSNVPSVNEVVGNTSIFCQSPGEFAETLESLENNPYKWNELSQAGYDRIRNTFSYNIRKKFLGDAINYIINK